MDDAVILEMKIFRAEHPAQPPELELSNQLKKLKSCMERMHITVSHLIHDVQSDAKSQATQRVFAASNASGENHNGRSRSVLQGSGLP